MQFVNIEIFLTNINFLLLFLTTIFYLLHSASFLSSKFSFVPNLSILISCMFQAIFLGLRWFLSGHFPLSNLYESLLFLSLVLSGLLVFFNNQLQKSIKKENLIDSLLGSLLTPFILIINTFATFSLPSELKLATSLVPALKSNWLMMHVTFMVLSYGALLSGCLLAIAFLIVPLFSTTNNLEFGEIKNSNTVFFQKSPLSYDIQNEDKKDSYNDLIQILDNLSYRIIGFGFPLLTIGILSGAVWANQTWGSYWSWDPKETWALITWLVFAIYLHARISYGWIGKQSALIASFGFIIIWICYLGVNLLGKGLHSYGFFN
uniref:Cytochrome c biogenesis protein CcsA n=1 Tax=Hazenia capsulata TaxID=2202518 RepID=A0A1W6EHE1_9CHLO|nr:heme attachment to plastid cytochrome c [Hazenia capsulata]ARK14827.1 heme attachment to plastid cytochrome c [Hazenia capsulata]